MVRFEAVSKSYPQGSQVLDRVSFTLAKAEFAFLTGVSGAGKTTLLKLIYGQERPTSGRILVAGRDLSRLPFSGVQALRRRLGVVFQDGRLMSRRDLLENVTLVLRAMGLPSRRLKVRALEVLKRVGLTHRLHSYPGQLSGGEQQRVSIARAMAADPDLLLADEPTGNLDEKLSLEILEIFKRINARGTAVLLATHDPRLLAALKRRQLRLVAGRLLEGETG
ncbi:MAG: cell division ATP-binding protein FtsE [Acidobacteriota bacterium]